MSVRRRAAGGHGDPDPDEASLRAAAEAGEDGGAYAFGRWLVSEERPADAEPWLRRAVHSAQGAEAALHLGYALTAQDRSDEAEAWWVAAALGGSPRAAYNLGLTLDAQGRMEESGHWYRAVLESEADTWSLDDDVVHRLAARRVDDAARALARRRDWPALWELILSVPVTDAAGAARHLSGWTPPDQAGLALAQHLGADGTVALTSAVADRAAARSTRILPVALERGGPAEVAGQNVLVLPVAEFPSAPGGSHAVEPTHRIVTIDAAGEQRDICAGRRSHASVACLGAETVVAVRSASETDAGGTLNIRWELVQYEPGNELVLASGVGAPMPRVVATEHGYIAGMLMAPAVIMGGIVEPPQGVDVSAFGLRYRTDRLAVDPTGQRVAFGDDHIVVVTDAPVERRIAVREAPIELHGPLADLTFTSPDGLVTSGDRGLCRWAIERGSLRPELVAETRWTVRDLFAVPTWGIVGGTVHGGRVAYFDAATLAPVVPPHVVAGRQRASSATVAGAAPGGRYVAYSGQVLVDEPRFEESYDLVTAVHDLHHPLSWVSRPPATLSEADLRDLTALLDGRAGSGSPQHALAADEKQVLELIRLGARHHLSTPRPGPRPGPQRT